MSTGTLAWSSTVQQALQSSQRHLWRVCSCSSSRSSHVRSMSRFNGLDVGRAKRGSVTKNTRLEGDKGFKVLSATLPTQPTQKNHFRTSISPMPPRLNLRHVRRGAAKSIPRTQTPADTMPRQTPAMLQDWALRWVLPNSSSLMLLSVPSNTQGTGTLPDKRHTSLTHKTEGRQNATQMLSAQAKKIYAHNRNKPVGMQTKHPPIATPAIPFINCPC